MGSTEASTQVPLLSHFSYKSTTSIITLSFLSSRFMFLIHSFSFITTRQFQNNLAQIFTNFISPPQRDRINKMAGMLPGVESARRRRCHGTSAGWADSQSSSIFESSNSSRRSSLCLYSTNHSSHFNLLQVPNGLNSRFFC